MREIRVSLPEYFLEMNVAGQIFRPRVDEKGPFLIVTEDQEQAIRAHLLAGVTRETLEGGSEHEKDVFKPDLRTQKMNVADAGAFIQTIKDMELLAAVRDGEILHPDYPGGRKGVLNLIDSQFADIEARK